MKRLSIIYISQNVINNKIYIGQTINSLNIRKNSHLSSARNNSSIFFHRAIRKYGEEKFIWKILTKGYHSQFELDCLESFLIKQRKSLYNENGYNISTGGNSPTPMYGEDNPWHKSNTTSKQRTKLANKIAKIKKENNSYKNPWINKTDIEKEIWRNKITKSIKLNEKLKGQKNPASSTNMSKEKRLEKARIASITKTKLGIHKISGQKCSKTKKSWSKKRKELFISRNSGVFVKGQNSKDKHPRAKVFIFITPQNESIIVKGNMADYLKENNLSRVLFSKFLNKGKIKKEDLFYKKNFNHIGWEFKTPD